MDKVFPLFIPNVASGINLKFPPYMYLIIFVGVMLVYLAGLIMKMVHGTILVRFIQEKKE